MFTLSTRTKYGVEALMAICEKEDDKPVSLLSLAKEQNLSAKYLETIFKMLKSSGLVRSERGSGGGFRLSKLPAEITLFDIMQALDGPLEVANCIHDRQSCGKSKACPARPVWQNLEDHLFDYLKSKTLESIRTEPYHKKEQP